MWQNNFMKSFLLQVIFLFTFFFAEDASADKKLPVLEKDLYLKGLNLFFNDLSRKFYGYELLIRLHNVDDEETMRILETCEREYQEDLEKYSKKYSIERAKVVTENLRPRKCRLDYEKKRVAADIYLYLTDELKINRNRFLKAFTCKTEYEGDGNEFIKINYNDYSCTKVEGELEIQFNSRMTIQRSNLLTRFSVRFESSRVEINKVEFIDEEEYKKLYQQIDDKHKAYMKKVEEESLL
tara:strand:+ start:128 stop:844 length:717 start_codon:yes stop_codon:yes gene_type:complete